MSEKMIAVPAKEIAGSAGSPLEGFVRRVTLSDGQEACRKILHDALDQWLDNVDPVIKQISELEMKDLIVVLQGGVDVKKAEYPGVVLFESGLAMFQLVLTAMEQNFGYYRHTIKRCEKAVLACLINAREEGQGLPLAELVSLTGYQDSTVIGAIKNVQKCFASLSEYWSIQQKDEVFSLVQHKKFTPEEVDDESEY